MGETGLKKVKLRDDCSHIQNGPIQLIGPPLFQAFALDYMPQVLAQYVKSVHVPRVAR